MPTNSFTFTITIIYLSEIRCFAPFLQIKYDLDKERMLLWGRKNATLGV